MLVSEDWDPDEGMDIVVDRFGEDDMLIDLGGVEELIGDDELIGICSGFICC